MQLIVDELRRAGEVRRRPAHRDHRGGRRTPHRGPDRRGGRRDHGHHTGYIKRTALTTYRSQRRGGKGRIGMRTREEDFVAHLFVASTHDYLMIFSDRGRAYWLKVHEIPGRRGPGTARARRSPTWSRWSPREDRRPADGPRVREAGKFVVMGTRQGVIKKTELTAFSNPRAGGIIAMGVEETDAVIAVRHQRRARARSSSAPGTAWPSGSPRTRCGHGPDRLRRARHLAAERRRGRRHGGAQAGNGTC
jgi:DNA gyrase/topoisomerase IV subunit A